jgi:two-component system sensor histidine kinase KdpD
VDRTEDFAGRPGTLWRSMLTLAILAALTAILWWADRLVHLPSVPLLYLPVVIGATMLGAVPGVLAAVVSAAAYHILFVAPKVTLRVAAVSDIISIAVYLATTIVLSLLISRLREAAAENVARAEAAARAEVDAEAARRSDELKSGLLSLVSHELRSPLTAIKANVGALLHVPHSSEDAEALSAIDTETDRLARMVRNLLDASRIEAGQLRPVRHPVRLRRLVGELADRARLGPDRLDLAVPPDVYVSVDPVLTNLVFQNLIENAERYGRPHVRVEARREGDFVRVSVSDRGPGVTPEALDRIFDRFVRLGREGVGLGLAVCRAIVEAHDGRIAAANAERGGLVISFTLPAAGREDATREGEW